MMKKCKSPYKIDSKKKINWIKAYKDSKSFTNACKAISVTRQSIYDCLKRDLKFVERKKEIDDEMIEVAVSNLHKRANGFEYTEVRVERENQIITKQTATKKFIAPDIAALIFLLCNRKPEEWKNTQNVEHKVEMTMARFMEVIYETQDNTRENAFRGSNRLAKKSTE